MTIIAQAQERGVPDGLFYRVCGIEEYAFPSERWDLVVSNLKEEVATLNKSSEELKEKVAEQDRELYSVYYIVASKADLIAAGVITRGGLFKSSKVSYESERNSFVTIDSREITSINTNAKKAKVLSVHPAGSYALEKINDEIIISISDPARFWEQTRYLVVQTN